MVTIRKKSIVYGFNGMKCEFVKGSDGTIGYGSLLGKCIFPLSGQFVMQIKSELCRIITGLLYNWSLNG